MPLETRQNRTRRRWTHEHHQNANPNEPRPPERRAHGLATTNGADQRRTNEAWAHEHFECRREEDEHVAVGGWRGMRWREVVKKKMKSSEGKMAIISSQNVLPQMSPPWPPFIGKKEGGVAKFVFNEKGIKFLKSRYIVRLDSNRAPLASSQCDYPLTH